MPSHLSVTYGRAPVLYLGSARITDHRVLGRYTIDNAPGFGEVVTALNRHLPYAQVSYNNQRWEITIIAPEEPGSRQYHVDILQAFQDLELMDKSVES